MKQIVRMQRDYFPEPDFDHSEFICGTPQHNNTYTPPMAHAWGGSLMVVVCVMVMRIVKAVR